MVCILLYTRCSGAPRELSSDIGQGLPALGAGWGVGKTTLPVTHQPR